MCCLLASIGAAAQGLPGSTMGQYLPSSGTHAVAGLPVFGNTIVEPTVVGAQFFTLGDYFVAPASGTYTTAHVYCSSTGTATQYFAVYNATSAPAVNGQTLIAQTLVTCPSVAGWATAAISVPVVSGNTYFFVGSNNTTTSVFNLVWDTTSGVGAWVGNPGTSPPATASGFTNQPGLFSMYLSNP